jgi:hypothetical protein
MKMLPRKGAIVEPALNEIRGPAAEDGRIVTRSIRMTVEREVLSVLLHQPGVSFAGHCAECGREAMLLTVETAARLGGTTPRTIYRWVEGGKVHFQEDAQGHVFVCSESLKSMERLEARREPFAIGAKDG